MTRVLPQVIGEGYHPKAGEPHAEVFALRAAGTAAEGATAYVRRACHPMHSRPRTVRPACAFLEMDFTCHAFYCCYKYLLLQSALSLRGGKLHTKSPLKCTLMATAAWSRATTSDVHHPAAVPSWLPK